MRLTAEEAYEAEIIDHLACKKQFGEKPADPEVLLERVRMKLQAAEAMIEMMLPVLEEVEAEDKLAESYPEIAAAYAAYREWADVADSMEEDG